MAVGQWSWKNITGPVTCQGRHPHAADTYSPTGTNPSLKKRTIHIFVTLAKIGLPLLLIAWLLSRLDEDQVRQLRERQLDWPLVGGAFLAFFVAVCLSFLRWHQLVRALGIPFSLRDAFRLGFLGFLFNFISVGNVGGDLFKAVFIAREQPGRRTLAVASVFVDRVAGLLGLILLAALSLAILGLPVETPETRALRHLVYAATAAGTVGISLLFIPGFTTSPLMEWFTTLPKIGRFLEQGVSALRMYRRQPGVLAIAGAISLGIHLLSAICITLLAQAIFDSSPSLAEHLVIVPLSNLVGALPVTPAGLGTFEVAMESLYRTISGSTTTASAVTVALAYRVVTIGIALIGIGIYWWSRRELAPLLHAAPEELPNEPAEQATAHGSPTISTPRSPMS